ncbi:hypothetical protein Pint_01681 [Pistacia integerrima]|uniref:Uncharacterized protein n=1 Tax=Pistacia integerrima TaxID=434235 RepID=A0ACC0ZL11_9ROSI|nr:hypothetical protein Pint_01681 [Pistacia integerrima]
MPNTANSDTGFSLPTVRQRLIIAYLFVELQQRVTSYNPPVQSTVYSAEQYSEKPVTPVFGVGIKADEEQLSSGTRKKVTFDSNVKTYEPVLSEEVTSDLPEISEVGKQEKEKEKEENLVKSKQSQSSSEASSITSSSGSYPSNYRYQNCRESDDEDDELVLDSDLDDDDEDEEDDGVVDYDNVYEDDDNDNDYAESRISVGKADREEVVESSLVTSGLDKGGLKPIRDNRSVRDRSAYVHSVLNPVENLTQWKAVKAKGKPQLKQQKENFTVDQEPRASFSLEPSFKELSFSFKTKSDNESKKPNQEVAVDASLSNWLSSSETTPINKSSSISLNATPEKTMSQGSNSLRSQEDRPILGALTLEEIKQFSASSSPRKSPSRSPDEMPIIGSVGSYWSPTSNDKGSGSVSSYKGIPNTTSKYREDKTVNWYSTPFETRLERALNRGSAGCSTQKS